MTINQKRKGCLLLSNNLSNTVHTRNCRATNQQKKKTPKQKSKQLQTTNKKKYLDLCTKQRGPLTKIKRLIIGKRRKGNKRTCIQIFVYIISYYKGKQNPFGSGQ
jgi:hypothetical protein